MFLQPYVENSIWHGVLPMKKPGKIEVDILKNNEEIKFTIEDNGIGINQSLELKESRGISHDSRGMMITSSRINVLRKITKRNIQIIGPFEMQDEHGKSIGTKVEIVFPLEKNTTFNKKNR
jgi:sensor histidine kinase YesM